MQQIAGGDWIYAIERKNRKKDDADECVHFLSDLRPEMENDCSTNEIREAAENVKVLMELLIEQKRKCARLKKSYEEEKRVTNTRLHNGMIVAHMKY